MEHELDVANSVVPIVTMVSIVQLPQCSTEMHRNVVVFVEYFGIFFLAPNN